jgi:peroxiredoxin
MPDLTLPDVDGKPVRLTEPKGKVILLNFWATWCPPCLEEMPSMEKLHRRFRGRPFEVIAVSVDKGGVELVRQFIKKRKFTFRVLHDAEGKTETPFGLRGLPISYVVNHRGQLIAGAIGAKNWRSKKAYAYFKGLLRKIENN